MMAVTFYFWNLELTEFLQICIAFFIPFMVDLTFGKTLNIWEESQYVDSYI